MSGRLLPVAGVMLAGGRASRMGGRDKAFATVAGEPIALRTVGLFKSLFSQVIVVTHRRERFAGPGVDVIEDVIAGCGPLGGIHAAMQASFHPWIFVVGCDMPGLSRAPIEFLAGRIGVADAIVPRWEDDIEPLHALYAVRTRDRIEASLRAGVHGLRDVLPHLTVDYVPDADLRAVRGGAESLLNVNTPEELAAVGGRFAEPEPGLDR